MHYCPICGDRLDPDFVFRIMTAGRASAIVCSTSCERAYVRILAEEERRAPIGASVGAIDEAFMKVLTDLGATFIDTTPNTTPAASPPCPECGLHVGHWSRCSHLGDSLGEREG